LQSMDRPYRVDDAIP